MRQTAWVPCNCQECYFCINGLTTGIDHKKRKERVSVVYAQKNKRVKMTTCADVAVRVKLAKYAKGRGRYCGMCYRNQPGKCSATKKKKCRRSYMGCPFCEEPVCKSCWNNYDHNPGN